MKTINIPQRYCKKGKSECHFLTFHGEMEEDFCGLYMEYIDADQSYDTKKKPEFCKGASVTINHAPS